MSLFDIFLGIVTLVFLVTLIYSMCYIVYGCLKGYEDARFMGFLFMVIFSIGCAVFFIIRNGEKIKQFLQFIMS